MVKIEFDIPKWAIGKHIYIFANKELLAQLEYNVKKIRNDNGNIIRKQKYFPLKLKPDDGRCNGCGDCCATGLPFNKEKAIDIIKRLTEYTENNCEGACPFLDNNGCSLGINIPFGCAKSDCSKFENCTEKFVELEVR